MEMEIPLPDELEWLEANFHKDCSRSPSPDPYISSDDALHRPDSPQITGHNKRSMPSRSPIPEEKRIRVDLPENDKDFEDDWLHDSLPPEEQMLATEPAMKEREKSISKYVSEIDGDFVPVTAPNGGDRVYAKLSLAKWGDFGEKPVPASRWNNDALLGEPVSVLLDRMEQDALNKAMHSRDDDKDRNDVVVRDAQASSEQLWVDKYAPKYFTELLSDEQTNREVLMWLKQWDPIVFGSEVRSTADEVLCALRHYNSVSKNKNHVASYSSMRKQGIVWKSETDRRSFESENKYKNNEGVQESQKQSRGPGALEHKILLLCGPPGLGKTTLAHVAAKHCGYRVVEVNASDDRSTAAIESKILDVVQMNSVTADARPKCLVIDEIDGALGDGKGAVEVILKMLKQSNEKENARASEQPRKNSSKKGRKTASLLRPVICICNDLYAPALRPLRQVAKVHVFVQPTITRIVNRLKFICSNEGMNVSSIGLSALADCTECDIRACLNTLQFLNRKNEALNAFDIASQVVGRKDVSRSAFDIWKEIFTKRMFKKNKKIDISSSSMSNKYDDMFALLANRGDYDFILDGIYENILQLQYHDPVMQKTVTCFDTLCASDLINQHAFTTQQMSLLAYSLATRIHLLVAQVQKPKVEWPKSYQKYRTTHIEKIETLHCWQKQMPPYISRHLSSKSFVEDSLTPLLHILSPSNLRPLALHLLTEKEKCLFLQLVDLMVSYAITYRSSNSDLLFVGDPESSSKTSRSLVFDPPFHLFISFKDYSSGHHALPLPMKQILIHEVEKQKILKVSKFPASNEEMSAKDRARAEIYSAASSFRKDGATPTPDNAAEPSSSTAVDVKKPPRASVDFFARFRKAKDVRSDDRENGAASAHSLKDRGSRPLIFKYNEGFTNGIKRPVRMREFLS